MNTWREYVALLLFQSGKRESEFLVGKSVKQGTFNRWKTGAVIPDKAAVVALFARDCGRNPLEAFVAAGMLTADEAGRGLTAEERKLLVMLEEEAERAMHARISSVHDAFLRMLDEVEDAEHDPAAGSGSFVQQALSEPWRTTQDAIAAHEDGDIAGEQEDHREP